MDFPIFCRKKGSLDSPERVLLNINSLAEVGWGGVGCADWGGEGCAD